MRVLAHEHRPVDPLAGGIRTIACVIARICASVNVPSNGVPRCPLVPKLTVEFGNY
jgi:hypothetical protein